MAVISYSVIASYRPTAVRGLADVADHEGH